MDAIKLLKTQHDEVEAVFAKFEKTGSSDEKLALFQQLGDMLAAHATIEEKVFYPTAYQIGREEGDAEVQDLLHEAVEEHLSAKRIIADLLEMNPDDEAFEAKVLVLKEQIEHHVEEEEGELFKSVQKAIPKEDLEAMGVEMEELFNALLPGEPRFEVPKETEQAAPLE